MTKWLQAKVVENRQWNERLFSLRIAAPLPQFKAGQFLRVALEIDGEIIARPYSLVNAPGEAELEIFFNIVEQGPLTPRLAGMQPGSELLVSEAANGFLVIDEIPQARYLWMFATGTGIGPFLSILKTEQAWQRFEKIVLAYSVRSQNELAYPELIAQLEKQHGEQLCFVPLVTRQAVPQALNMRVTGALVSGALEARAGIKLLPETSHVMMCGNSEMITEVSSLLADRGMQRHRRREPGHITTEKYH